MRRFEDSSLVTILVAEDDPDDREQIAEAMATAHVSNELKFTVDGRDLLDYLNGDGEYRSNGTPGREHPRPGLILLDLNMPRMDGREALEQIKADEHLRNIPVIVMTTSDSEEDIVRSYNLGVSSFITKPVTFSGLVEVMQAFSRYWFEIVELPSGGGAHGDSPA